MQAAKSGNNPERFNAGNHCWTRHGLGIGGSDWFRMLPVIRNDDVLREYSRPPVYQGVVVALNLIKIAGLLPPALACYWE
jgi:hypothetical protein